MADEEMHPWDEAPFPCAFSVTETGPGVLAIRGPLSTDPVGWGDSSNYTAIKAWVETQDDDAALTFDIDSPGGDVAGLEALVAAITAHQGPTVAVVTGCAGSAAYWLASACDRVVAWPSATVGSVGAMMTLPDSKGGTHDVVAELSPRKNDVDDPQWQEIIDESAKRFLVHVAARRRMDGDLKEVAARCGHGKLMTAAEAVTRGLVDNLIEEGSMDPDQMPEVEPEKEAPEKTVEEEVADHRARLDDLTRRIDELEAVIDNLKREREDASADEAEDAAEESEAQAACDDRKPRAYSAQIAAMSKQLAEVRRAQRDDTVARLVACGKVASADAEVARFLYDNNPRMFERRYGRPQAMSVPVTRISSGEAAATAATPSNPTEAAWAAVAASGGKMSFLAAYKAAGGR